MDCAHCGRYVNYDRVAVHRLSGAVVGGLCIDCEATWLNGEASDDGTSMGICFECGEKSEYLFPQWDSIVESESGGGSVDTEYRIRLTTPSSCADCLER